jgi:opacity protein-like surface antigen
VALPDPARSDTAKTIVEATAGAAFAGIFCASVALTADDEVDKDDFARRGWSVGIGGSYASETFEDDAEADFQRVLGPDVDLDVDENTFGINGHVGYRCHRRFSAEVEVEWLDAFSAELTEPGFAQLADVDNEPLVVTTNVKGYLLTGRTQPFLLIGAGAMTAHKKLRNTVGLFTVDPQGRVEINEIKNAFAMRFGGGIDIYATTHVVVSLGIDYVLPFGKLDAMDYISVNWGIQYRF